MTITRTGLQYRERTIEDVAVPTLEYSSSPDGLLDVCVRGTIINSVTERSDALRAWKVKVATAVKGNRGSSAWPTGALYAVSLALRFCPALHGNRDLDVENFVKPIIDATAAGLFMPPSDEPAAIERWDFDDSNFNTLLIHRLPDTQDRDAEGVAIFISRH